MPLRIPLQRKEHVDVQSTTSPTKPQIISHVWKGVFASSLALVSWIDNNKKAYKSIHPKPHKEVFYDTANWDLALLNIWIKKKDKLFIVKYSKDSKEVGVLHYKEIHINNQESLRKWITTNTDLQSLASFGKQTTLLTSRLEFELEGSLCIRIDLAEFPEGDVYCVGSALSKNSKEKVWVIYPSVFIFHLPYIII